MTSLSASEQIQQKKLSQEVVIVVGKPGCGKSTLIKRFTNDDSIVVKKSDKGESCKVSIYKYTDNVYFMDTIDINE